MCCSRGRGTGVNGNCIIGGEGPAAAFGLTVTAAGAVVGRAIVVGPFFGSEVSYTTLGLLKSKRDHVDWGSAKCSCMSK